MSAEDAVIPVDKPIGWTSHDVVSFMRRQFKTRRVGHAGTLDPLATGTLVVMIGKATRLFDVICEGSKEYIGSAELGASSLTQDCEGVLIKGDERQPQADEIQRLMRESEGSVRQTPPLYSAVHIGGKRAHRIARSSVSNVVMPPRDVEVFNFSLLGYEYPNIYFRCLVSRGTYVRTLVHDLGKALQTGAHLTSLRRLSVGGFTADQMVSVDSVRNCCQKGEIPDEWHSRARLIEKCRLEGKPYEG